MAAPLALRLAEWSAALRWDALPPDVRARVPLWILDHLGLVLAAADSPPGRAALAMARVQGGVPESAVAATADRLPAAWAALVHGTLAHAFDFDDTVPESVVHPGSVVVATALAVAQAAGADGPALATAIAAGYEIAARLGAAAGRAFHARGFQATSAVGPLAAAAVAARLRGLSPEATARAMGLAGSMSGGLLACLEDGSWAKRLHPGWAAHGGVVAAALAALGFSGPASVLEGRHGLYAAFLGPGVADLARITAGLGTDWLARGALAKRYPCAHVIHPFLDAAAALSRDQGLRAHDVAEAWCDVPSWQVPIVCEPRAAKLRPRTEYDARASLPVAVAAMLADGRVDLATFTDAALARPTLLALAARVRHRERAADARAGFEGTVEVVTRDGRRLVAHAGLAEPPEPEAVRAKFRHLAGHRLSTGEVEALEALVLRRPAPTAAALLAAAGASPTRPADGPAPGPRSHGA
jgi:2-methylcitrate dehydratase PrpD